MLMVSLVYIEGICVLYSFCLIVLVVFGCFALDNSHLSLLFPYSPGFREGFYFISVQFMFLSCLFSIYMLSRPF